MKNNYFKSLLFAAVWLLTSLTASAQFTAKVEQTPRSDWGFVPATFAINEVAEALGTDGATLLAALDSWMAEGSTDPNMFFYAAPSAPDTWSDGYTTGGEKGFWIGEDAEIIGYPDGAYYCNPVWDSEAGTFSINIGMMPDALKYGVYQKELKFALQYGGKTATFTIDFTVTGAEQVDIPEPAALKEVDLNIVGEAEVTVEQYPRGGYDAANCSTAQSSTPRTSTSATPSPTSQQLALPASGSPTSASTARLRASARLLPTAVVAASTWRHLPTMPRTA